MLRNRGAGRAGVLNFQFFSKTGCFGVQLGGLGLLPREHIGRSGSSKVIDFGTNWKRVSDFLLVRHCNLGPILSRFIAAFRLRIWPRPYSTCSSIYSTWGCFRLSRSPIFGSIRVRPGTLS